MTDWLQCCSSSCVINLGDTMLITGGALGAENRVSEYSEAGYLRDLPPLIVGRYYHGCSYYHNDEGVKTFLVTGGYYKDYITEEYIKRSSTELLVETAKDWVLAGDLPSPTFTITGVNIHSRVFMTGVTYNIYILYSSDVKFQLFLCKNVSFTI